MNYQTIPQEQIPRKQLADGSSIPAIGLGTFGSDSVDAGQVQAIVEFAIRIGYRHIDCASIYGNEKEIGEILAKLLREGFIEREELWITSKVWNNMHGEGDVSAACRQTLQDLQLDYLDLYLVHWPFPNHHEKGVSIDSRDPHAQPYIHENYMKTWQQMEELQKAGLVRYIGTSNMTTAKLELLLRDASIKPSFNEMELHPHFQQAKLFEYVTKQGIIPIGFSPIGSPGRPERDRTPQDTVDIEDPVIVDIAESHKLHPVQVCLKWAVQRGQIPIPFSSREKNIYSNLLALSKPPLSEAEMKQIIQIDKNSRLIKGQVFLWPKATSWKDLWDLDGTIKQ